ncbi:MAG TPA: FAD-dependent 5-carboxymethylaminomethyl-2-thiouridine(34) oxidoreductase MnmC [Herbaspirillum sp.]
MPTVQVDPALAMLQQRRREQASVTLLDLDFGDGLRLLTVAAALLREPNASTGVPRVHYVAVIEAWPDAGFETPAASLAAEEDNAAFKQFCAQLRNAWLPRVPGFQRLVLADGRLLLTLVSGTVENNLPQLTLNFDVCYCRIAEATSTVIRWLGRLAAPRATLAMDAAMDAGHVDGGASNLNRIDKEIAQAGFVESETTADHRLFQFAPRHSHLHVHLAQAADTATDKPASEKHAIVIGGGLAGAAACHRLSARGWRCTLIEQEAKPAQQASGNAAGIFMPMLSQDDNPLSRLTRAAYLFALPLWEELGGIGRALPGQVCGVLQLARSDAAVAEFTKSEASAERRTPWPYPSDFARWLDSAEAAIRLGLQQRVAGGWWFPRAGWLHPAAVCEAMLAACGDRLQVLYRRQAERLTHDGRHWHVFDADGSVIANAPVVILANGVQATHFGQAAHLPLSAIRGQVTHLPADAADMPFVVCGDAYLTPAANGIASLGATYGRDDDSDASLRLEDHQENVRRLQQMLPDWRLPPDLEGLDGRVGFRCVAADRLPLVGGLPDLERFQANGNGDMRLQDMPRLPGLYGLLAYGSRGLIWSPLAAELLAAQLNGEPLPLPRNLTALLDPARFALKQRRHGACALPFAEVE